MPVTISPDDRAFDTYYERLDALKQGLKLTSEGSTRRAFSALLEETAKARGWTLAEEVTRRRKTHRIRLDGVLYGKGNLPRGYWEAKDERDDLDAEILRKRAKDYPIKNIIFEDTARAVLLQDGVQVDDVAVTERDDLARLLTRFYNYDMEPFEEFDKAVEWFAEVIPDIGRDLKAKIDTAHRQNKRFQQEFEEFMALCRTSLNPNISRAAVDEMLIQHLLTERLIRNIFQSDFTSRNIIADKVEGVISALTQPLFDRSEFQQSLDTFYHAIERAAKTLADDYQEKQQFINTVYEQFFQGYSVKTADTHGIVYTPQEIVDFMCAAVEDVLQTEFGKTLGQEGVAVLDPATGTGNFIINLLNRVNPRYRRDFYHKYLFANEVMLMPYYIASLNIEHEYYMLEGEYAPFEGLAFVDTLDLAKRRQLAFDFMTEANSARVKRQQDTDITVIIGNPPYNVGQINENDNNKNRTYDVIDGRVRETYAADSNATNKNALYDAYVKFFRWATDRLEGRDGVVCYVTNNSFIDQIAFDGMRKHLLQDFHRVYHIDLHGNVRQNPKLSGTTHNVFGIQVGVGITVAIKSARYAESRLYYHRVPEMWTRREKLEWLAGIPHPLVNTPDGPLSAADTSPPGPLSAADTSPPGPLSAADTSPPGPLSASREGGLDGAGWKTPPALWAKLKPLAQQMRHEPTPAENALWARLRNRQLNGLKFRRQHSIDRFIVDFYCAEAQLIVEVDGAIHQYTQEEDALRQAFFESTGLRVLRFANEQVLEHPDGVLAEIAATATQSPPAPTTSPSLPAERGLGGEVPFDHMPPNAKHTWLVSEHEAEYERFVPMGSKDDKRAKRGEAESVFKLYSRGAETTRDAWVYSFNQLDLIAEMQKQVHAYNQELIRYQAAGRPSNVDDFVQYETVNWSSSLKQYLQREKRAEFSENAIRTSIYRPFAKKLLYFEDMFIHRPGQFPRIFPTLETEKENRVIWLKVGSAWPMFALMVNQIPDLLPQSGSQCFPFYVYDEDGTNRRENITDWALAQFRAHYADEGLSKWDIFYYVYGLLHHPGYRERYADNLKRELPRLPYAPDFHAFASAGRALAQMHLSYEEQPRYAGIAWETDDSITPTYRVEKMRPVRKRDAADGDYKVYDTLRYNDYLTLTGIPEAAFAYRLGNRSAIDWIVDQYRVKTDKRSGITSDPNGYSDDPQYIIKLLERVVQVSVKTLEIVNTLAAQPFRRV